MVKNRLRNKETNRGKVHTIYTPAGFGWISKVGRMGISSGNNDMFLAGRNDVKVIRTCTENPRVGSSILSLGTIKR
jgi:hypothetical protein